VVVGLLVLTAGFFAAHATASAWVGARATTARAQATSLYNVAYYSGSALLGWLLGYVWSDVGWGGVALGVSALCAAALVVALAARNSLRPTGTGDTVHAVPHERRSPRDGADGGAGAAARGERRP
ncbi:MAG: transporter, partial [Humibacillus sp.]|nr:transporter [Humibacillus sp.]